MTDRYEIAIQVLDAKYIDTLVAGLVRQGYNVYYNADLDTVCFTATDDEVTKLDVGDE